MDLAGLGILPNNLHGSGGKIKITQVLDSDPPSSQSLSDLIGNTRFHIYCILLAKSPEPGRLRSIYSITVYGTFQEFSQGFFLAALKAMNIPPIMIKTANPAMKYSCFIRGDSSPPKGLEPIWDWSLFLLEPTGTPG